MTIWARAVSWWPNLLMVAGCLVVAGLIWRFGRGLSIAGVMVVAALCQVPGLTHAPITSTDAYRYVWDGRVQLAGHSPYAHVPLDDALAGLRDPLLFPGLSPTQRSGVSAPPSLSSDPAVVAALAADDPRTLINRPRVPTIYPPIAQVYFTAVAAVTPWAAGTLGLQIAAGLLALVLTWLLAASSSDRRWAALWGWSPIVVLEAGSAAHVDVLGAVLITGAVIVAARRPRLAGILLGAAASVKLLPLLLVPAFRVKQSFIAFGTFIATYIPYLVASGALVLGFLPGYLSQEGFSDGSTRFTILSLLLPPEARQLVAVLIAGALAVLAFRRRGREPLAVTCCWLYGAALLLATPTYPWYGLPLIALAALSRRPEWIVVPLAAYLAYATVGQDSRQGLIYMTALVIVVIVTTLRHRPIAAKQFDESLTANQH
ncbi:glycosyltransferase 87 family protein [Kribbella sp. NBC_01505]|uniref:glycosyltransferase 87 family protein n=1 Tax=Kribbella sp. NBC_01505 TaxID=2903580 RepID=UPI003864ECD7